MDGWALAYGFGELVFLFGLVVILLSFRSASPSVDHRVEFERDTGKFAFAHVVVLILTLFISLFLRCF